MKKFWICALSLLMAFSMTACADDVSENTSNTSAADGALLSASVTCGRTTLSTPPATQPSVGTTRPVTTQTPDQNPPVGQGIFDGLNVRQIWDQVMSGLSDSTGFDVTVVSDSDYTVNGEHQTENQSVQIQFNADSEGECSYSIQTRTDREIGGQKSSESLWQAYQDGWFYQSGNVGGTPVSGRIALDGDALADLGLDAQSILALNAMVDMGSVNIDGASLEQIFREVTFETLDDGRYRIACTGIRTDLLLELLSDQIGVAPEGDDVGALIEGLAQLLDGSLTMEISKTGLPEKITSSVSLKMSEPMEFSVTTGYTLTVNAIGSGAGKVTLPDGATAYPEYESYEDFLAALQAEIELG